jgi:hypothetical protein
MTAVVNKPKSEMGKEKQKCFPSQPSKSVVPDVMSFSGTHAHRAQASMVIIIGRQRLLAARVGTGCAAVAPLCSVPHHTTPRFFNAHRIVDWYSSWWRTRARTHKTGESSCGDRARLKAAVTVGYGCRHGS